MDLVREARKPPRPARPVDVSGPFARELAAALAAGGRPALVRIGTGEEAAVLVRVLAGAPTEEDVAVLRRATREQVPVVAVQTAPWRGRVPYVPATEVVEVPPGAGFPVERIAEAVARIVADDAAGLAAGLPLLAGPVRRATIRNATALAALVAGTPLGGDVHLPVISAAQTRMLGALRRTAGRDAAGADPKELGLTVGPEVVAPLGLGVAARALVRCFPRGGAPLRAGVAAAATAGLGLAALRLRG